MKIILASGNQHKADEIAAMLPEEFELVLQSSLGISSPPETGTTFLENALIKARHANEATGLPALADDSGLCVDALDGAPGIRSARYAGEDASDAENVSKLLDAMQGEQHRSAMFYCLLVLVRFRDDPAPMIADGRWTGEIASARAGDSGFGYDPVFYLPDRGCSAAELETHQKNAISHRGIALRAMTDQLRG